MYMLIKLLKNTQFTAATVFTTYFFSLLQFSHTAYTLSLPILNSLPPVLDTFTLLSILLNMSLGCIFLAFVTGIPSYFPIHCFHTTPSLNVLLLQWTFQIFNPFHRGWEEYEYHISNYIRFSLSGLAEVEGWGDIEDEKENPEL